MSPPLVGRIDLQCDPTDGLAHRKVRRTIKTPLSLSMQQIRTVLLYVVTKIPRDSADVDTLTFSAFSQSHRLCQFNAMLIQCVVTFFPAMESS